LVTGRQAEKPVAGSSQPRSGSAANPLIGGPFEKI
jgi:hypothetical protein